MIRGLIDELSKNPTEVALLPGGETRLPAKQPGSFHKPQENACKTGSLGAHHRESYELVLREGTRWDAYACRRPGEKASLTLLPWLVLGVAPAISEWSALPSPHSNHQPKGMGGRP